MWLHIHTTHIVVAQAFFVFPMTRSTGIPPLSDIQDIIFSEFACLDFLLACGVLYQSQNCAKCSHPMSRKSDDPKQWRCDYSKCRAQSSVFKHTIFAISRIPCNKILHLGYMWLKKASCTDMIDTVGLSDKTITAKCKLFAQAVSEALEPEDDVIGGIDVIVEIDECLTAKPKYHRGHAVHGCWVLGGVERTETRKVFMVQVPDRRAETLIPILAARILPGSIVYSDLWKAYDCLTEKTGLLHETVNHSENFKDPITGVHTNTIESTWSAFKRSIEPRRRTPGTIDDEIEVFIWRRKHAQNLWKGFLEALSSTMFI